ncbi:MAG: nucleotidyltransferase family protein [Candidatus ainarchaeum sp.]|nr:nucleotidyltransferase family protein [Candidatus ainarchaeum sp.]
MAKAVVLCGGMGTRLRPYTYSIPKPMLPLGKKPILEFVIGNLKANGFKDLALTVGYRKEQIMDYFGNGSRFGVKIKYFPEDADKPLNTAGSILPAKKELSGGTFLVVMGDHLTSVELRALFAYHRRTPGIATLALKRTGVPLEYGVAHLDGKGRIARFDEKPIVENLVNAGMYAFEPEVFDYISEYDDFAKNVFPKMLAGNEVLDAYVFDDYWLDIGRTADYEQLNETISTIELVTRK